MQSKKHQVFSLLANYKVGASMRRVGEIYEKNRNKHVDWVVQPGRATWRDVFRQENGFTREPFHAGF